MARGSKRSFVPALLAAALAIGAVAWFAFLGSPRPTQLEAAAPGAVEPAPPPVVERDETPAPAPRDETPVKSPLAEAATQTVEQRAQVAASADLELADALWVEGVVRFPDGTPLDETVEVVADGKKFEHRDDHRVKVGPDGRFRVAFAKKTRVGWLRLDAPHLYLATTFKLDPSKPPVEIVLEPVVGGRITGSIVPPPGATDVAETLKKARVQIWGWTRTGQDNGQRSSAVDAGQRFELRGVPPHLEYHLSFDTDAWTPISRRDLRVESGKTTEIELVCSLGARVAGRVVDASDRPVEGASVEARIEWSDSGTFRGSEQRPGEVAKDGTFSIRGIRPGKVELVVTKRGYLEARHALGDLADGDVRESAVVRLDSGHFVAGRVAWPDGAPAAGAFVRVEEPEREDGVHRFDIASELGDTKVEADGSFRVTGLQPGPYVVTARAREGMRPKLGPDGKPEKPRAKGPQWHARAEGVASGSDTVELLLQQGMSLAGRVIDDTGAPVTKFSVTAAEDADERGFVLAGLPGSVTQRFEAPDGRFELQGLKAGSWGLVARAAGFNDSVAAFARAPGDGAPLTLVVTRCAVISGIVVDASGRAIAKASVSVEADRSRGPRFTVDDDPHSTTDEHGRFEIDDAPSGSVEVSATHTAFAGSKPLELTLAAGQRMGDLRIVMHKGGSIRGELHASLGDDLADWHVWLQPQDGGEHASTETDAAGRFAFERVTPGAYAVTASKPVTESDGATRMVSFGDSLMEGVNVAEGETAHVVLGAPYAHPIRVTGVVTCAGKPAVGARVSAMSSGSGAATLFRPSTSAESGIDGRYELAVDGAGEYTFSVGTESGATRMTRHVTIAEGASVTLDFELPNGRIAGRLVGPDGAPVEDVWVMLQVDPSAAERSAMGVHGWSLTEADGVFAFENLAPGLYQITVTDEMRGFQGTVAKFGSVTRGGLRVEEGGALEGIEIRLDEAAAIAGTVRTASGAPAVGANVIARNERGDAAQRVWGRSATDGAGRYRIEGLSPGAWSVSARTESEASDESAPVRLSPGSSATIDLHLRPGTVLRVVVEDADGRVVGAAVSVRDARGLEQSLANTWFGLGADTGLGRRVGPLPPGTYDITATNHDGVSASARVSLHGEAEKEVRLRLGGQ